MKLADTIDNVWTLACSRADEAGRVLASVLRSRAHVCYAMRICTIRSILNVSQGARPVTLIGYSVGARVIFACLEELHRLDEEDRKAAEEAEAAEEDEEEKSSSRWKMPWKKDSSSETEGRRSDSSKLSSKGLIEDVILLGAPTNVDVSVIGLIVHKSFISHSTCVAGTLGKYPIHGGRKIGEWIFLERSRACARLPVKKSLSYDFSI